VHLIASIGGLAWFTQLFPHVQVAKNAGGQLSFYGTPAEVRDAPTDFPSVYGKFSPFQSLPKRFQVSAFIAGTNETPTATPSTALGLGSNGLLASIAAIQASSPTLLPVMAINPFTFGSAPGAPQVATVGSADGLVQLFNSAASRTLLKD